MRQILEISIMITSCIFFVVLSRAGVFPVIPGSVSIPAPEAIQTPKPVPTTEPILAFKRIPASEKIPVGTAATINKMEYVQYYAFQQRSLPEHGKNFWKILFFLNSILINILMCWLHYRHLRRDSYRKDETKQELRQLRMLIQKCENDMLKLRGTMAFMEQLEERCAQLQNDMDSVKNIMKRLPFVLAEETVGDAASKKPHVKFGNKAKLSLCSTN
jgi:hypothetical protein